MNIFLIGYMYSGKTVVAHKLSQRLGYGHLDLDQFFEFTLHTSIPIFFQRYGEEAFRKLEQKMLHDLPLDRNLVIATGGGTPCYFDNMDYINAHGTSIYLKASPELIIRRALGSRKPRPILKGKSPDELDTFVRQQMALREPYYAQARYTFPADDPGLIPAILSALSLPKHNTTTP